MKRVLATLALTFMALTATSCRSADEVSYNISREADEFNVYRKVTVMNNQSDKTMLEFEGWASIEVDSTDNQLEITYRVGKDEYYKDFIGLNDRTTYVITQLDGSNVDKYHYEWFYHSDGDLVPITIEDADKLNRGGNE